MSSATLVGQRVPAGMRVLCALPPNYEEICAAFDVRGRNVVFAYGDVLYAPTGDAISHHLMAHERQHQEQQRSIGPAAWWTRYLADAAFRLSQEVEAYRAQLRVMSRPERQRWVRKLAGDLAGPIYGNLVPFAEAKRLITEGMRL